MNKRIRFLIFLFLICAGTSTAEEKTGYTLSGEIKILKAGRIYLQLVTKAQYEDEKDKKNSVARIILEPSGGEVKAQKIFFKLENIPAGTYTIQCYQDLNANNKMDIGVMGFGMEPYGYYKPGKGFMGPPDFKNIKFSVDKDMSGIKIILIY